MVTQAPIIMRSSLSLLLLLLLSGLQQCLAADKFLVVTGRNSYNDAEVAPIPNSGSSLSCPDPQPYPIPMEGGVGDDEMAMVCGGGYTTNAYGEKERKKDVLEGLLRTDNAK